MFNNIFRSKKKEIESQEEKVEYASVKFYIDDLGAPAKVSVVLDDYTDECCASMCTILTTLTEEGTPVETFQIIKQFLEDDGRQDMVLKLAIAIGEQHKLQRFNKATQTEEPCIKPSEMIF